MSAGPKPVEPDDVDTFVPVGEPAERIVRAAGEAVAARKDQDNQRGNGKRKGTAA